MKLPMALPATTVVLLTGIASTAVADYPAPGEGSRYDEPRYYHSEISAADAYKEMMLNQSTLIDVRRLKEYAAGHPERSYNVPYPHIVNSNDQSALDFYWYVYAIVNGDTDAPITTLCRTGARSVSAANILANPESHEDTAGMGLEPFTNVRNIWEGFVGQLKYAYDGGNIVVPPVELDLDDDGLITQPDIADVYAHTADANPDKDGWRNFQQLPWSTKIRLPLAYQQNPSQYECWQTDEGCL